MEGVCPFGAVTLRYHLSAIEDLHAMLRARGDWMALGDADEQKEAKPDTVEAWRDGQTDFTMTETYGGLLAGMVTRSIRT